MGKQPIPNKIKDNNPEYAEIMFKTLLVDGSNVLETCYHGCKKQSKDGKEIGGIYQFLLQIKIMLGKANFRHVYVFWDGDNSGQKRYNIYPMYKQNRDKEYNDETLSDYMKKVNEKVKAMQEKAFGKRKSRSYTEKKELFYQRGVVMECLEELFIRQYIFDEVEADDLIAYYTLNKRKNERIVIMSNDRDLSQLISEDVIIYLQSLKKFVNLKNNADVLGCDYRNIVLKKTLCGDASDNIKGIKGVGETTLIKNFPELGKRKVELGEIVEKSKKINEERAKNKKKPLLWAENIVNSVTNGVQGDKIYFINYAIINLLDKTFPMMTDESKSVMKETMFMPIDIEDRNADNLYRIIYDNGIEDLTDETNFGNFFVGFGNLISSEKKYSQNNM